MNRTRGKGGGNRASRRRASAGLPPFEAVLEQNRAAVYRFLYATAGPQEADDLFQETFLAALRAYPKLGDAGNLRGWLLTIATRKAIDAGRARDRRPVTAVDPAQIEGAQAVPGADQAAATRSSMDGSDGLWQAVGRLPARQRAAVVHRFVLDLPYADVASAMGCSEEAARANVYEAVRKLRKEPIER